MAIDGETGANVMTLAAPDWRSMFTPTVPLLEIVLRGTAVFLVVFAALRLFRREGSNLGAADLLLLLLVADAVQNAMGADYHSLSEGFVLVATLIAWSVILDWLSFRYPWAHRLIVGVPLLLVDEGQIVWRNLRRELLTRSDLMEQLRAQGIADLGEVRQCRLEPDGRLSVLKSGAADDDGPRQPDPKKI